MSDLETRLTEALRAESEAAPDALGLADAARTRARARRRTTVVAVGAVAVAALAVPVAVLALGGSDRGKAPVANNPTASGLESADTGRWESWHGVTVLVPEDWEYGNQSTWCADGGSVATFRVTRPGGVVPSIACTPGSSYGLAFQEIEMDETDEPFDWPVVMQTGDAWPPGTFVGAHGEDGVLVTVAGPDREDLLEILATVRTYGSTDPYGCGDTPGDEPAPRRSQMLVCRYDPQGRLVQSEALSGKDATAAAAALDSARPGELDCQPSGLPGETILMKDWERDVVIELDGACTVVEGTGGVRLVDADIFYWALSPGWTGDATGLPLPDRLRP
jgi:hypothetical protein